MALPICDQFSPNLIANATTARHICAQCQTSFFEANKNKALTFELIWVQPILCCWNYWLHEMNWYYPHLFTNFTKFYEPQKLNKCVVRNKNFKCFCLPWLSISVYAWISANQTFPLICTFYQIVQNQNCLFRTNSICCREYIFFFCEYVLIWFEPIKHFLSIWWGLSFKY